MNYLNDEQLNELTDKRLLALYKSVRRRLRAPWKFQHWDANPNDILIKNNKEEHNEWYKYSRKIKHMLDERPHVEKFKGQKRYWDPKQGKFVKKKKEIKR